MQTFLVEGSFPTEQRLSFSQSPPAGGVMKKNKYTTLPMCQKPCSFSAHSVRRVFFQRLPVDQSHILFHT